MSETSEYDKVYEVNKDIKVNSVMQLIDINGSKVNFQSDCLVQSSNPLTKIMVAIVNQDELDNGNVNFEPLDETGKYARRVSFQENVKKNHFICIKKHPSEQEDDIDCSVVIRMKELPPKVIQQPPPLPKRVPKPTPKSNSQPPKNNQPENSTIKNENIELKKQLEELRKKQEYQNKKESIERFENDDFEDDIDDKDIKDIKDIKKNKHYRMIPEENDSNSYYKISMICLALFTLIVFYKFLRK